MKHPNLVLAAAALLALTGAGCSTTPKIAYHALQPVSPQPAAVKVTQAGQRIAVGPVTIPSQFDRAELVVQTGDHRTEVMERQRWAAPLKEEIARVLAANLARLRKNSTVVVHGAQSEAEADLKVVVDVGRLELEPGVAATLEALWTVQGQDGFVIRSSGSSVRIPAKAPGYEALTASLSESLQVLARQLAAALPPP